MDENLIELWDKVAKEYVDWLSPWKQVVEGNFHTGTLRWFIDGRLNVSLNCLDRHLSTKANQAAIIWEGDTPEQEKIFTFALLHQEVCRMANGLKALGITKGDVVAIYMPMIPEAAISMLACARIGAVHTVIFAGFSAEALQQRLKASECKLLITADGYKRGGKPFDLKAQVDQASDSLDLKRLIVKFENNPISFEPKRDYWWSELKEGMSPQCPATPMDAEDPFFILYTSGSTGHPKGLVHTTGGYLVQAAYSQAQVFACSRQDVFWCTADIGWITGHTYLLYGPLCNGITTLMFSGLPTWPNPSRCWEIIDKHRVSVFYTAPTAIRSLKRAGDEWLKTSSRKSLRLLGSVGEPINPEVWLWYQQQVGLGACPIVDTWWQTETGSIMIAPFNQNLMNKPGSAGQPLKGIIPVILDEHHQEIHGPGSGALAIKCPWPSLARTIAGDHHRYRQTYFQNGYYITGDGASRDADGDYWIFGRLDDVLNVSGHRLGTAEIESALVSHPKVAEAAVVGVPHPIKGQAVHAFVSLKPATEINLALKEELINWVKIKIGAIAKPESIDCVHDLPKTRSGKIMRRILRLIAGKEVSSLEELGDLSTLANPQVVKDLLGLGDTKHD